MPGGHLMALSRPQELVDLLVELREFEEDHMSSNNKAAISLTTGLEDAEKVTVAFLVAVGAAESGRPTMMFLTKEAVRLAVPGVGVGTACDGCPPLEDLMDRYAKAGGRYLVCPICIKSKQLDDDQLHQRRRTRRDRSALGLDRRRRHHVQLLGTIHGHRAHSARDQKRGDRGRFG